MTGQRPFINGRTNLLTNKPGEGAEEEVDSVT